MSTKAEMLACLDREIQMRRRVYPNLVAAGRMTQRKADEEIAIMTNVRDAIAKYVPADPVVQQSLSFERDNPKDELGSFKRFPEDKS